MDPCIIQDGNQYAEHTVEANWLAIQNPEPGSAASKRLELVLKLLRDYRELQYFLVSHDPIDAITRSMKERCLRNRDLAELLGGRNRVSEVLARRRPLTLHMIRALHQRLELPLQILLRPYSLDKAPPGESRRPKS